MRRILFLDPDGANQALATQALAVSGAQLTVETSTEAALDRISLEKIHLVVMDLALADRLLLEIRDRDPLIQVIISGGSEGPASILRALEHGANDYLPFPYSEDQLRDAVKLSMDKLDRWYQAIRVSFEG